MSKPAIQVLLSYLDWDDVSRYMDEKYPGWFDEFEDKFIGRVGDSPVYVSINLDLDEIISKQLMDEYPELIPIDGSDPSIVFYHTGY